MADEGKSAPKPKMTDDEFAEFKRRLIGPILEKWEEKSLWEPTDPMPFLPWEMGTSGPLQASPLRGGTFRTGLPRQGHDRGGGSRLRSGSRTDGRERLQVGRGGLRQRGRRDG